MKISLSYDETLKALSPIFDGEDADALINGLLLPLDPKTLQPKKEEDIDLYLRKKAYGLLSYEEKKEAKRVLFDSEKIPPIVKLDPKPFSDNPYAKILSSLPPYEKGDLRFLSLLTPAYLPFSYKEKEISKMGNDLTSLGYFAFPFSCFALQKGGVTWMSLLPHEIMTMEKPLSMAKGKVLCLGLGLGYFPFMAASKDEVSEVTVIEKDPAILSFFKELILPALPCKEKLHLVEADALKPLKEEYDFCFADLWHDPEDGLPLYCRLLKDKKAKVETYWIEKDILVYLRRYLAALVMESLDGYGETDYRKEGEGVDRIYGQLYFATKNVRISSVASLKDFLSLDNVKSIAKSIDL